MDGLKCGEKKGLSCGELGIERSLLSALPSPNMPDGMLPKLGLYRVAISARPYGKGRRCLRKKNRDVI